MGRKLKVIMSAVDVVVGVTLRRLMTTIQGFFSSLRDDFGKIKKSCSFSTKETAVLNESTGCCSSVFATQTVNTGEDYIPMLLCVSACPAASLL